MWVLSRMNDEMDELRTVSFHATLSEAMRAADELAGEKMDWLDLSQEVGDEEADGPLWSAISDADTDWVVTEEDMREFLSSSDYHSAEPPSAEDPRHPRG
jgi:hypothetical protein